MLTYPPLSPKNRREWNKGALKYFWMTKWMSERFLDWLPTVWLWAKHLTSLGSNFLICKMSRLDCSSSQILWVFSKAVQYFTIDQLAPHSDLAVIGWSYVAATAFKWGEELSVQFIVVPTLLFVSLTRGWGWSYHLSPRCCFPLRYHLSLL